MMTMMTDDDNTIDKSWLHRLIGNVCQMSQKVHLLARFGNFAKFGKIVSKKLECGEWNYVHFLPIVKLKLKQMYKYVWNLKRYYLHVCSKTFSDASNTLKETLIIVTDIHILIFPNRSDFCLKSINIRTFVVTFPCQ